MLEVKPHQKERIMAILTRFKCDKVEILGGQLSIPCEEGDEGAIENKLGEYFRLEFGPIQHTVHLTPVLSGDDDDPNKSFSKSTPAGSLELMITNPAAFGAFTPGHIYNITIAKHQPAKGRG